MRSCHAAPNTCKGICREARYAMTAPSRAQLVVVLLVIADRFCFRCIAVAGSLGLAPEGLPFC